MKGLPTAHLVRNLFRLTGCKTKQLSKLFFFMWFIWLSGKEWICYALNAALISFHQKSPRYVSSFASFWFSQDVFQPRNSHSTFMVMFSLFFVCHGNRGGNMHKEICTHTPWMTLMTVLLAIQIFYQQHKRVTTHQVRLVWEVKCTNEKRTPLCQSILARGVCFCLSSGLICGCIDCVGEHFTSYVRSKYYIDKPSSYCLYIYTCICCTVRCRTILQLLHRNGIVQSVFTAVE